MSEELTIGPDHEDCEQVDLEETEANITDGAAMSATICGLLRYLRTDGGYQVFIGINHGTLWVNFSKNGRITSRLRQSISVDQIYRYDARNASVGFTCI